MTSWGEVVTAALLGTARRGVAGEGDPARALLDLAATHRVRALAGRRPESAEVLLPAEAPALPAAPAAADRILAELLERPDPTLVNLWLAGCAERGCGAAPEHWTRLAVLAARSTAYDRPRLLAVLGAPGQWFLDQNAAWRRLVASGRADQAVPVPSDAASNWPADAVAAALEVLGETSLGKPRRGGERQAYAARLGAEMPLPAYPMIARAAERRLYDRPGSVAERRLARECFVACEEVAWIRIRIRDAFDPPDTPTPRREIPPLQPSQDQESR